MARNKKEQTIPKAPNSQQAKTWQWWIEKVFVPILLATIPGYFLLLSTGVIENPFNKRGTSTAPTSADSLENPINSTPPQAIPPQTSITNVPATFNVLITATPVTALSLSPTETVVQYYQYLNDKEYSKAWGMFSMYFKIYGAYSGIEEYKEWASNINKVEVIEPLTILEESELTAVVEVSKVIQYTNTGTNTYGLLKIYLSRLKINSDWQIEAIGM